MDNVTPILLLGGMALGFYYLSNKNSSSATTTTNSTSIDSSLLTALLNNTNKTTTVDTSGLEKTVASLNSTVSELQKQQSKDQSTAAWISTANTGIETLGKVVTAWLTSDSNSTQANSTSTSTNSSTTSSWPFSVGKKIYEDKLTQGATLTPDSVLAGKTIMQIRSMTSDEFKSWCNSGGNDALTNLTDANRYRYNELVAK